MTWNDSPEYVALVFIAVILVYSKEPNMVPTLKNKIFHSCLYVAFGSTIISILSTLALENHKLFPMAVDQVLNTLYYILTPAIAVIFTFYVICVVFDESLKVFKYFKLASIPYLIYILVVLVNPLTKWLYYFTEPVGYYHGPLNMLIFVVYYIYIFIMLTLIIIFNNKIEKNLRLIMLSFPLLSLIIVLIQQLFLPEYVLSGTVTAISLLIIYLYIQNKKVIVDDLTSFFNRKAFTKMLELYMRDREEITIALISLDDFRTVNDKFGFICGDKFLRDISKFFNSIIPRKNIFRYSGDEFAVIFDKNVPISYEGALEQIKNRFLEKWSNEDISCTFTNTIAVIKFPEQVQDMESAINLLEYCIKQGKKEGKDRIIYASQEIIDKVKRRNQIIDIMRRAIKNNEFEVHYQPIFNKEKNKFSSAESLVRLYDISLGNLAPNEFIPIAEETGMIVEIGYIVLDMVCKYIKNLENMGIEMDAISVNFSALQMSQVGLKEKILHIINSNGVNPNKIRIEITESIFIGRFDEIRKIMLELGECGIKFYLDDFGTGYSNLASVVELPFEYIKLDKTLLPTTKDGARSFGVTNALSKAFTDAGFQVLFEGVETKEQNEMIEHISVGHIQGYYYARPMVGEAAKEYLERAKVE